MFMENTMIFRSVKEVRFSKLLSFIIPTYLTSLFNTVYTIVDGIFVSEYVGTNALAAINIVYPIVNILTGIALVFASGGSSIAALHMGAGEKEEADRSLSSSFFFSILLGSLISIIILFNLTSMLSLLGARDATMRDCQIYALFWLLGTPIVIGKELFTYFIRADGSPSYSFATALAGDLQKTRSLCLPLPFYSAHDHLCPDMASGAAGRILLCKSGIFRIFTCRIRYADLWSRLPFLRFQYFLCNPLYVLWQRSSVRMHYLFTIFCLIDRFSSASAGEIRPGRSLVRHAGC